MAFGDVKTPKGLQELNNFLAERSYVNGYSPSKSDLSVFEAIGKAPTGNVPHVQRWYRHIVSYSVQERGAWGGQALAQVAGAQPTVKSVPAAADDDDVDLFGSDDEDDDAETARIKEERVAAYAAKKSNKPVLIAKSSVMLDVKPWDDETDMAKMQECVRSIQWDGLVWGAAKLVPVGYGIHKLQIICVIEDDKISTEELSEEIEKFEDYVQSVDIAAFNKI